MEADTLWQTETVLALPFIFPPLLFFIIFKERLARRIVHSSTGGLSHETFYLI